MTEEELKNMEKAMKKARRIATEKAGELHDLVEDRLPAAYREIMPLAQKCLDACKAWDEARTAYEAAGAAESATG